MAKRQAPLLDVWSRPAKTQRQGPEASAGDLDTDTELDQDHLKMLPQKEISRKSRSDAVVVIIQFYPCFNQTTSPPIYGCVSAPSIWLSDVCLPS